MSHGRGGGHDEAYFLDREGDPQIACRKRIHSRFGVAFVIIGVLDRQLNEILLRLYM